jgi:hypothetical protein
MTNERPSARRLVSLLVVTALAWALLGAGSASAITRADVLARAQRRVDFPVAYSQVRYYAGYRTDCSGYVSMCWATGTSYSTRSFYLVTHPITPATLKPGDALLKPNYHIRMFYGWLDPQRTRYISYESASGQIAGVRVHSIADDLGYGYTPVRFDRITDGPRSLNALQNASFNTWHRTWSGAPEELTWWKVEGQEATVSPAARSRRAYRTAYNALRLSNTTSIPESTTAISQEVRASAGVKYLLGAWARTNFNASLVDLRVAWLGPSGETLAENNVTGDRAGLDSLAFRKMSLLTSSPTGTVSARVTLALGGGSSFDASGTAIPGTAVYLDDISLVRPAVSIGIRPDVTSFYRNRRINLAGSVSPTASAGTMATVYVKRPGATSWRRIGSTQVFASGSTGYWRGYYYISSASPRGLYRFKVTAPGVDGYLAGTSGIVTVRKR